jgi:hypothetical protein
MPATAGVRTGIDGAVYRNSGTDGSPTWVEIDIIRDVSGAGAVWDMGDASSRASRAKLYKKTQADIRPQLVARADSADTGYQALYDAANSPAGTLDLLVLDGPLTEDGATGFRSYWNVNISTPPTQGAGEIQYTTFELSPAWNSNRYPSVCDVGAASALTLTAL